jgi:hypothetical protein
MHQQFENGTLLAKREQGIFCSPSLEPGYWAISIDRFPQRRPLSTEATAFHRGGGRFFYWDGRVISACILTDGAPARDS